MNIPLPSRCAAALGAVLLGCASGSNREGAPAKVDAMVTWIERVHVEAERAREAVAESFERLNAIAAGRFDKDSPATLYARLVKSTDSAEQQARRYRETVGPMLESAKPVFAQWQADLKTIASDRLRERSEMRYAVARERYEAIAAAAVPAQQQFDAYVRALRDHATFLANDLNAGAIAELKDDVKQLARDTLALDRNLDATMAAARAYVEQSSLPSAAAEPPR